MRNPVIRSEEAEQLNKRIREVDKRLFLFCHYKPMSFSISEDGYFMESIDNIYKFAIDSSYLLNDTRCISNYNNRHLRQLMRNVDLLRSIKDHNQSPHNGQISRERILQFNSWIEGIINKTEPSSIDDYTQLNTKISDLSRELIREINICLDCCISFQDRDSLVQSLIAQTIKWYSTNTKTEIYKGQLASLYLSEVNPRRYNPSNLFYETSQWLEATIPINYQNKRNQLDNELFRLNTALANIGKIAPEKQNEIKDILEKQIQSTTLRIAFIDSVLSISRTNNDRYRYYNYFINNIANHIRETMAFLDEQNEEYNMLPESLLQRVAKRYVFCEFD